jgi:hypothetical protein
MPWSPTSTLAKVVYTAGFTYDDRQNIILSRPDALQRRLGYAYGYDDLAPTASMIIDCEPIFFDYGGKSWMIEFWKGQYGLMTGCEIGVYTRSQQASGPYYAFLDATVGRRPKDPDGSHSRFFDCASDADLLEMSFDLSRRGQKLFSRGPEKHWWLTGFKWGELSNPDDLSMNLTITFPNPDMTEAFKQALIRLGYGYDPLGSRNSIRVVFDRPRTYQPRQDSAKQAQVAFANSQNASLVADYNSLRLSSNDPNGVTGDIERRLTAYFANFGVNLAAAAVANMARSVGKSVEEILIALLTWMGTPYEVATQAMADAGVQLSEWIGTLEERLGLRMDYSCRVQLTNTKMGSELIREDFGITAGLDGQPCGQYLVTPSQRVAPGGIDRFWIRDFPGAHGAEGWVVYSYMDSNRRKQLLRFEYGCPTGVYKNYARAQAPFTWTVKEGNNANWTTDPEQPAPWKVLHPLTVAIS